MQLLHWCLPDSGNSGTGGFSSIKWEACAPQWWRRSTQRSLLQSRSWLWPFGHLVSWEDIHLQKRRSFCVKKLTFFIIKLQRRTVLNNVLDEMQQGNSQCLSANVNRWNVLPTSPNYFHVYRAMWPQQQCKAKSPLINPHIYDEWCLFIPADTLITPPWVQSWRDTSVM